MTRQNWLHKWLIYALALLPVWWLDAYVLSRYPLVGVTPTLLPLAAAAVGVLEGASGGAGFGLGTGLLWACAYPGSHGLRVLALTLVGLGTGAVSQYALAQTMLGCLLCSAVSLAALEGAHVLQELFFLRSQLQELLSVALPRLGWSLCWAPLIYILFRKVYRRVGGTRLA